MHQNPWELLRLHNISRTYGGGRPSQLVSIDDEWAAYQFDMAVLAVGRLVEKAMDDNAAKKKGHRKSTEEVLRDVLGEPDGAPRQFAPVAGKQPARTVRPGSREWEFLSSQRSVVSSQ